MRIIIYKHKSISVTTNSGYCTLYILCDIDDSFYSAPLRMTLSYSFMSVYSECTYIMAARPKHNIFSSPRRPLRYWLYIVIILNTYRAMHTIIYTSLTARRIILKTSYRVIIVLYSGHVIMIKKCLLITSKMVQW